jgi:hypothetical protein
MCFRTSLIDDTNELEQTRAGSSLPAPRAHPAGRSERPGNTSRVFENGRAFEIRTAWAVSIAAERRRSFAQSDQPSSLRDGDRAPGDTHRSIRGLALVATCVPTVILQRQSDICGLMQGASAGMDVARLEPTRSLGYGKAVGLRYLCPN